MVDYDFGASLKEIRTRAGLNQTELEIRCGFNPNVVSNWEIRHSNPPLPRLRILCQVLACSANEILGLPEVGLSEAESERLYKMRQLDEDGLHTLDAVLDSQLLRLGKL